MLPVIMSSKLFEKQEEALISMLKQNKKALGWTLANLSEISLSYSMHKIRLDEGVSFFYFNFSLNIIKFSLSLNYLNIIKLDCAEGSREDDLYMSLWHLCIPMNAVRTMQCAQNISKVYDGNFFGSAGALCRSLYG